MSNRREQTHRKLLEAARDLFEENGVSVRLEDVGAAAGVSRQSVYLHFGSRAGLLTELMNYLDEVASPGIEGDWIRQAPDARSAIRALINQRARYIPIIYPVAGPVVAGRQADPEVHAAYTSLQNARRHDYEALVARMKEEGLLADGWDTETAVEAMKVMLSIPSWEQLVVERGWSNQQYAQSMHRLLTGTFVKSSAIAAAA